MDEHKDSFGLTTRIYVRIEFLEPCTTRLTTVKATRSAEDGLTRVDLNRNVEALYDQSTTRSVLYITN